MKLWWVLGTCVLGLSACGGGDEESTSGQTPFQVLIARASGDLLASDCSTGLSYSVLETGEARSSNNEQIVDIYDREAFFGSENCTGNVQVQVQVQSQTGAAIEVPRTRIVYQNSLKNAQVVLLDGRRFNTAVDRVTVYVNPEAGVYHLAVSSSKCNGIDDGRPIRLEVERALG